MAANYYHIHVGKTFNNGLYVQDLEQKLEEAIRMKEEAERDLTNVMRDQSDMVR